MQLGELGFSLEKRRFREDRLVHYMKGGYSQVVLSLFSQVTSNRTGGDVLKLCQGRFRFNVKKYFLPEEAKHLNRFPSEVAESPIPRDT